jgi:hypothetical protein
VDRLLQWHGHPPQADKLDDLFGRESLALGDLILTEVLQGIGGDRDIVKARRLLTSFMMIAGPEIAILPA